MEKLLLKKTGTLKNKFFKKFIFYFLILTNFYNTFSSVKKKSSSSDTPAEKKITKDQPKNIISDPIDKKIASQFYKLVKINKSNKDLLAVLKNFYFDKKTWNKIKKFNELAPSDETFNQLIEIIKNKLNSTINIDDSNFKNLIDDFFIYKFNEFSKDQFTDFLKKTISFLIKKKNFEEYSSEEDIDIKKNFVLNLLIDISAKAFFEKKFPKKNEKELLKKSFEAFINDDEKKKTFLKKLILKEKDIFIKKDEYSDYFEIFISKLLSVLNTRLKALFPEDFAKEEIKQEELKLEEIQDELTLEVKTEEREEDPKNLIQSINEEKERKKEQSSTELPKNLKKNIEFVKKKKSEIQYEIQNGSFENLFSNFDKKISTLKSSFDRNPIQNFINLLQELNTLNKKKIPDFKKNSEEYVTEYLNNLLNNELPKKTFDSLKRLLDYIQSKINNFIL